MNWLSFKNSDLEKYHIKKSAEQLWPSRRILKEGYLDGYWPDFPSSRRQTWVHGWNSADVDEQGPIGIFAITIDELQPNTEYTIGITPIFHPSTKIVSNTTRLNVTTTSQGG